MTKLEWSHSVREVPAAGLAVERTATTAECGQVATLLDILGVEALAVKYTIKPAGGDQYRLTGKIDARVVQACVVTLDPVGANVVTPFEVMLVPAESLAAAPSDPDEDAAAVDFDAPLSEPIENGVIDIGRIVYEELASGLDPYPRRSDASFDWTDERKSTAETHPFADLARLRADKKLT